MRKKIHLILLCKIKVFLLYFLISKKNPKIYNYHRTISTFFSPKKIKEKKIFPPPKKFPKFELLPKIQYYFPFNCLKFVSNVSSKSFYRRSPSTIITTTMWEKESHSRACAFQLFIEHSENSPTHENKECTLAQELLLLATSHTLTLTHMPRHHAPPLQGTYSTQIL